MTDLRTFWPVGNTPSDEISIYEGPQVFIANYEVAPARERTVFAAYWLQAEVLNGGLLQFFQTTLECLRRKQWLPADPSPCRAARSSGRRCRNVKTRAGGNL